MTKATLTIVMIVLFGLTCLAIIFNSGIINTNSMSSYPQSASKTQPVMESANTNLDSSDQSIDADLTVLDREIEELNKSNTDFFQEIQGL